MNKSILITPEAFEQKLANKDGDFKGVRFIFPVDMSGHYDFVFDFSDCIFEKEFDVENASFLDDVHFHNTEFLDNTNFMLASFGKRAHFDDATFRGYNSFKRTVFKKMARFSGAYFHGDVFFDRTSFVKECFFKKAHFMRDVYFHRTFFGMRADFSYTAFADLHVTSFFSIRSRYKRMDGKYKSALPPRLVFRYVFFPRKAMFTDVDLSRVIFQNSMIEPIVFKDCTFSQKEGRNCFYNEIAKEIELATISERLDRMKSSGLIRDVRLNDGKRKYMNIGDRITFFDRDDPKRIYKTFITTRHEAASFRELFEKLEIVNPYQDYSQEIEFLEEMYPPEKVERTGVVAFGFKRFSNRKHWENLEDINRQMKKSLEDSKDWQRAGDFYVGEMEAMIELLRERKEKPVYRVALQLYGIVSGFCESVGRIFVFMMISFAISILLLHQFKPEFSFIEILQYSFGFYIPLLGKESISLRSLDLSPWQNIIIMLEIVWYYLLWFFLALTLQRKFKR